MTEQTFEEEPYAPDPEDGNEGPPVPRGKSIRQGALAKRPKKQVRSVGKSGSKILSREKQRQALELRKGGASYAAIAQAVGYNDASAARKAVVKAFGEIVQEPAEELKVIQTERLNHMLLALWPKIQQGDERSITTGLAIMDRLGAMNPQGSNVTVNTGAQVHGDAILVVDGSKEDFILAAKRMAGIAADGSTSQAPADGATHVPTGLKEIEGEVVETYEEMSKRDPTKQALGSLADALGPDGVAAVKSIMAPPDESGPLSDPFPYVPGEDTDVAAPTPATPAKTYEFGVDPDV